MDHVPLCNHFMCNAWRKYLIAVFCLYCWWSPEKLFPLKPDDDWKLVETYTIESLYSLEYQRKLFALSRWDMSDDYFDHAILAYENTLQDKTHEEMSQKSFFTEAKLLSVMSKIKIKNPQKNKKQNIITNNYHYQQWQKVKSIKNLCRKCWYDPCEDKCNWLSRNWKISHTFSSDPSCPICARDWADKIAAEANKLVPSIDEDVCSFFGKKVI